MSWMQERIGEDGSVRYTATYLGPAGRGRSAGTFTSRREADRAGRGGSVPVVPGIADCERSTLMTVSSTALHADSPRHLVAAHAGPWRHPGVRFQVPFGAVHGRRDGDQGRPVAEVIRVAPSVSSIGRSSVNAQPFARFSITPVQYRTTARHSPRSSRYWWTRVPRYPWPSWRTRTSRGTGREGRLGIGAHNGWQRLDRTVIVPRVVRMEQP